jgi:hypothetical protein
MKARLLASFLSGIVFFIAAFAAGSAANGEERLPFLGGDGAQRCQKWTEWRALAAARSTQNKETGRALIMSVGMESWILGFVSGISSETRTGMGSAEGGRQGRGNNTLRDQ